MLTLTVAAPFSLLPHFVPFLSFEVGNEGLNRKGLVREENILFLIKQNINFGHWKSRD